MQEGRYYLTFVTEQRHKRPRLYIAVVADTEALVCELERSEFRRFIVSAELCYQTREQAEEAKERIVSRFPRLRIEGCWYRAKVWFDRIPELRGANKVEIEQGVA